MHFNLSPILISFKLIPLTTKFSPKAPSIISAVSDCFCSQCNRIRMTSDGFIKLCLYYNKGINIKELINNGATDNEIKNAIKHIISQKPESHHFGIIDENSEAKNMVQIGG